MCSRQLSKSEVGRPTDIETRQPGCQIPEPALAATRGELRGRAPAGCRANTPPEKPRW